MVILFDTVKVFPLAMVKVADEAGAVMATLLIEVALAIPRVGVIRVGEVARTTTVPEPVVVYKDTEDVPFPAKIVAEVKVARPVPPWATERGVVSPEREVISELAPEAANPRFPF